MERTLTEIFASQEWERLVAVIPAPTAICSPDKTGCNPKNDGPDCQPAEKPACNPKYSKY